MPPFFFGLCYSPRSFVTLVSEMKPRKLGKYILHEEIGRGGMAVVYKAEQVALKRTVALKLLSPGFGDEPEALERFRREARAIAQLNHPNVVQIYDVESAEGQHFFAMEYCPGSALSELINKRGRLELAESLDILDRVASALEIAHRKGVVHRDIKPSNIIIDAEGKVKVTDFGIALIAGEARLTDAGMLAGSVRYVSPEQARGEALDGRSDIYSLGVVFYEMLVGTPPFDVGTPYSILDRHMHETPAAIRKICPELPAQVAHLVERMLAKERGERFANCTELRGVIAQLKDRVAPALPSAGGAGELPVRAAIDDSKQRTTRLKFFVTALVVLLAGGIVWWMLSGREALGAGKFIPVGGLQVAREEHTGTLLASGRVLVAGGMDSRNAPVALSEIYNPEMRTFEPGPELAVPRFNHTATGLKDGAVLIVGGEQLSDKRDALASAELFDPEGGMKMLGAELAVARRRHRAIRLVDGRVLIVGGEDEKGQTLVSTEIYDLETETFLPGPPMRQARKDHTMSLLPNGEVLVAGGSGAKDKSLASAEVFYPEASEFREVGPLREARYEHTATVLGDGTVLIAGGRKSLHDFLRSTEIYETGSFREGTSLGYARAVHSATRLEDGVLLVGGVRDQVPRRSEILARDDSIRLVAQLHMPRINHTATRISGNSILIVGGFSYQTGKRLASAELYVVE